jgi:hypothetical protein
MENAWTKTQMVHTLDETTSKNKTVFLMGSGLFIPASTIISGINFTHRYRLRVVLQGARG